MLNDFMHLKMNLIMLGNPINLITIMGCHHNYTDIKDRNSSDIGLFLLGFGKYIFRIRNYT